MGSCEGHHYDWRRSWAADRHARRPARAIDSAWNQSNGESWHAIRAWATAARSAGNNADAAAITTVTRNRRRLYSPTVFVSVFARRVTAAPVVVFPPFFNFRWA
jgi:hypothetical protein